MLASLLFQRDGSGDREDVDPLAPVDEIGAAEGKHARVGPTTPKRATARGASDHQERPEASSRQPAMMDVINLTGELHHSIETRKQIPACMALQWNETKDETA